MIDITESGRLTLIITRRRVEDAHILYNGRLHYTYPPNDAVEWKLKTLPVGLYMLVKTGDDGKEEKLFIRLSRKSDQYDATLDAVTVEF